MSNRNDQDRSISYASRWSDVLICESIDNLIGFNGGSKYLETYASADNGNRVICAHFRRFFRPLFSYTGSIFVRVVSSSSRILRTKKSFSAIRSGLDIISIPPAVDASLHSIRDTLNVVNNLIDGTRRQYDN